MEFVGVRTIDELGRVIVPKEARQSLGWDEYTEVKIFTHKDTIILERKRPIQKQETPDMKQRIDFVP